MNILHLDYESFSAANLKKVGAYRYAADPSTRILMMAIALNDEEPRMLFPQEVLDAFGWEQDPVALDWFALAQDPETLVYAHNAGFEVAVSSYRLEEDLGLTPPPLRSWRCTAAMARMAALPYGLEDVAALLGLEEQKDKAGSALIKLFCTPQKVGKNKGVRILPWNAVEKFNAFIGYCKQDVRTERSVHKKLRHFDFRGAAARTFMTDTVINQRGIPVNVPALRKAKVLIDMAQGREGQEFRDITGLGASQVIAVKKWFAQRGYTGADMTAVSVERALTDTSWADSPETLQAMKLKQSLSYSATAKVATMLNCDCGDGVVRGTLMFYGAGPGRWSGKLIQPQNFKRPTLKDTQEAYRDLCNGASFDHIELLYGPVLEVIASCIRHFMQRPKGNMYDVDYSSIEARGVCWLAGQEDALERYRNDEDAYIDMAAYIFNRRIEDVTKEERWLGKQTVLGCGYQMGWQKFLDQCLLNAEKYKIKGIVVTKEMAQSGVTAYREKYNMVKQLWDDTRRAATNAIIHPGKPFKAGKLLTFTVLTLNGIPYLAMQLPSRRSIVYPWPKIEKVMRTYEREEMRNGVLVKVKERKLENTITYYGKIKDKLWGRVQTYGGSLVENATQGLAADVMSNGAANALERGHDVITLIHDQALAAENTKLGLQSFIDALTDLPPWAAGLPIKADGKVVPFYLKL
jgi:DNA polymerase